MKTRIILTTFLMFLCAKGFAQDIIHTLDSNPIEAKIIEITDDDIRYKSFDNQEGPDYRISLKRVVRIVFENGTEKIISHVSDPLANLDESDGPSGPLVYRGGSYYDLRGRLYNKQMRAYLSGTPYLQDYMKGRNLFSWGSGLTVGGATLLLASAAGGGFYTYFSNKLRAAAAESEDGVTPQNLFPAFIAGGALGAVCLGAGIPLWIKGSRKLNDVADNYNAQYRAGYSARLDFGPTPSGIGFALRF